MRHRRRWAGAILVPAGALVLAMVEPAGSASAAHARTRIEPGTAAATASVLGITPGVSGLTLSATIGESSAAFQHTETQAKSGTLDLGSLGLVLATSQFCGRPELASDEQPHPIAADSETGPRHATRGTKGLGYESVAVDTDPESAVATTTTIDQQLPGLVWVRGRSRASVRYVDGVAQVATSTVTEDVTLLGGKIRFEGMHWTARRTSGSSTTRSTDFSFGRVTIGGVPMSAPDAAPQTTISLINKVLAPLGLLAVQPVRSTNHHSGAVAIGPFTLRFSGSALERSILKPTVNNVIAVETLLKKIGRPGSNCADIRQLIDNLDDNIGSLGNIVLEIAAGAGSLDLQFGGVAAAAQNAPNFLNPFGQGGVPPPIGGGPTTSAGTGSRLPSASPPGTTAVSGGEPTGATPAVAAAAPRCVSTSPSRAHSCWHGLATVAASGALAVGVALLVADAAVTRRRRTNAPPANPRSAASE
jgi:hypothetical protein